jgi:tRNA nucleotidyltransferase (CCA-adding enzyme)
MKRLHKKLSLDSIPNDLQPILKRFIEHGFDVWVVGGALRDLLLRGIPKDWDLATSASPQQVMELFPRVIAIGLRHGTVQIHAGQKNIEVTSCPAGGREGILADLKRRDFTINALALSYPEGKLIDPFDGQGDLLSQTLRAVDDAPSRFREDPLRTLRAGRFMSVYGVHLEPETFVALKAAAPELQRVSRERIREELFKMLLGDYFPEAFGWMVRGMVIQEVLPELTEAPFGILRIDQPFEAAGVLAHTVNTVHLSPLRLRVRLAALFHNLAELKRQASDPELLRDQARFHESALAAAEIMRRLRASRRQEQEVAFLVERQIPDGAEAWTDAEVRRFIASVGVDLLDDVMDLGYAEQRASGGDSDGLRELQGLHLRIFQELECSPPLRIQDLAITGRDVMSALGLKPGPLVGQLLRKAHQRALENPALNEPKILMDFLVKEYDIKFESNFKVEG